MPFTLPDIFPQTVNDVKWGYLSDFLSNLRFLRFFLESLFGRGKRKNINVFLTFFKSGFFCLFAVNNLLYFPEGKKKWDWWQVSIIKNVNLTGEYTGIVSQTKHKNPFFHSIRKIIEWRIFISRVICLDSTGNWSSASCSTWENVHLHSNYTEGDLYDGEKRKVWPWKEKK